jgi:hypothetical protein
MYDNQESRYADEPTHWDSITDDKNYELGQGMEEDKCQE